MQRDIVWRFIFLILTALLLAALAVLAPSAITTAPSPVHVAFYKLTLVMLAGCLGYALDVLLFPYGRPDSYLIYGEWTLCSDSCDGEADYPVVRDYQLVFAAAMIRRAIVVAACVVGISLGM